MHLIATVEGRDFWAHFDDGAKVWEVFADEAAQEWVGVYDTLHEARLGIPDFLAWEAS